MTDVRIAAAVVDTQQLILYKEDGEKLYIPQGDPRIRGIIDQAMPILNAGGIATISLETTNEYAAFEKKSSGLVRLFRVAKQAVTDFIGSDEDRKPVAPMVLGHVPQPSASIVKAEAINEILANATPVTADAFLESETTSDHTMIAVVGSGSKTKIVPGVEGLKTQMAHSNKLGSTKGVEALINRLSKVVEKRGHSVQDVMRFMEKGDLPVADDGSIIAYKILKRHSNNKDYPTAEGLFFDCHTGKIPQKVGSYVCVDEKLVDRNRQNECSNGLHIARRGYLGSFSGDVCVLIKMDPEDVVTVPHNDANKVRVCGYHILGLIPPAEFTKLRSNQAMTESSVCQQLLGQAISGQHIARLEQVMVTQQNGGGVVVTSLVGSEVSTKAPKLSKAPKAVALDDKTVESAPVVDPKAIDKTNLEQKANKPASRGELAAAYLAKMKETGATYSYHRAAAVSLADLKKRSKVSYVSLGLSSADEALLQGYVNGPEKDPEPKPAAAAKPAPKAPVVEALPTKIKVKAPEVVLPPKVEAAPLTRGQQASNLVKIMTTSPVVHARINAARQLVELKKKSKVSWRALNVSEAHEKTAIDLASENAAKPETVIQPVAKPKPVKAVAVPPTPPAAAQSIKPSRKEPPKALTPAKKDIPATPVAKTVAPVAPVNDGPRQVEAKRLYRYVVDKKASTATRQNAADALLTHKKRCKVSWTALGLPEDMTAQINSLLARK